MEMTIKGDAKEIAALVLAVQEQPSTKEEVKPITPETMCGIFSEVLESMKER